MPVARSSCPIANRDRQHAPLRHRRARGFTLVEIGVVACMVGILASIGFASSRALVASAEARNEAVRFATELRRFRSEAIQRQMYTHVSLRPGGVVARPTVVAVFSAKRIPTVATQTPCQELAAGALSPGDMLATDVFSGLSFNMTAVTAGGVVAAQSACFSQRGQPFDDALTAPRPVDIELTAGAGAGSTALTLSVDQLGVVRSSDAASSSGIAGTSLHPVDSMEAESAPVPPNSIDPPSDLPLVETEPGVVVAPGGTGDDGSGVEDLCGDVCPLTCQTDPTPCDAPCDVCQDPCSTPGSNPPDYANYCAPACITAMGGDNCWCTGLCGYPWY